MYIIRCFKVTSLRNETHFDIVVVLSDGSFACSSPRTANFGMPCREVLAVFRAGLTEINTIWHFHTMYQNEFVTTLKTNNEESSKSTCNLATLVKDTRCRVTPLATVDIAEKLTRNAWSTIDGSIVNLLSFEKEDSEVNEQDVLPVMSFRERVNKAFYSIKDSLTRGSKAAGLFFQAVEAAHAESLEKAKAEKNSLIAQYGIITKPITKMKGSSKKKRIKNG